MGTYQNLKAITLFLVILSLTLSLALFFQYREYASASTLFIISISDTGFSPSKMEIKKGQIVTFINKGSQPHWPASDPHPSHIFFKSFDPQQHLAPSQSWSIPFPEEGTFAFHDHLNHLHKGVIHVGNGKKMGDTFSNTDPRISPIYSLKGKDIWEYVKKNFKENEGISHEAAHTAGKILYAKEGKSALTFCDEQFSFGCYHGFIEEYSKKNDLHKDPSKICDPITSRIDKHACFHGLGHGFFTISSDLQKSLISCDTLDQLYHRSCYTGVFMEAMVNPITGDKGQFSCVDLDTRYQPACYEYFPHLLKYQYHLSDMEIGRICSEVTFSMKHECIRGHGQTIADLNLQTFPTALTTCIDSYNDEINLKMCYTSLFEERVFKVGVEKDIKKTCLTYLSENTCLDAISKGQSARS